MEITELTNKEEHEQVVLCHDKKAALRAIVAIHDTTLGPALGGCRFWDYPSDDEALFDVLRLSRSMTYKAAVAGLQLGGGKSVIIGDPGKIKSEPLFRVFGRFIQSLNGRYITAEDVNMRVEDMDQIAKETRYVTGTSRKESSGDPSPVTALGVFSGIKAAIKFRYNKDDLSGIKVAVQGCGSVGKHLCQYLHETEVSLIISDLNPQTLRDLKNNLGAKIVGLDEIHEQDVDVYAPCALGAILNDQTIPDIQAPIVAGSANNQLLDEEKHIGMLEDKNILYAPDYIINAGGLINVSHELKGYDEKVVMQDVCGIYDTMLEIFTESNRVNCSTLEASNRIAESRLASARENRGSNIQNTFDNQSWIAH